MELLFTLCGRAGSKGCKSKNLRNLNKVPLLYYSLSVIASYIARHPEDSVTAAISTDSETLIDMCLQQRQVSVLPIRREGYLAGDTAPKVAVISHCMVEVEKQTGKRFDLVIDLDITSPLRTVQDVEVGIHTKKAHPDTDCAFSVALSRRNPYFNMVKVNNGITSIVIASEYTTRQASPQVFDMNGSIYVYAPKALLEKSSIGFFNANCTCFQMKDFAVLDIDSEEDLEVMEVLAGYFFIHDSELGQMYQGAMAMNRTVNNT